MSRNWYTIVQVRQAVVSLDDEEASSLDTRRVREILDASSNGQHITHQNVGYVKTANVSDALGLISEKLKS